MQGLALSYLSDFILIYSESLPSMSTWEELVLCRLMLNKRYFLVLCTKITKRFDQLWLLVQERRVVRVLETSLWKIKYNSISHSRYNYNFFSLLYHDFFAVNHYYIPRGNEWLEFMDFSGTPCTIQWKEGSQNLLQVLNPAEIKVTVISTCFRSEFESWVLCFNLV